MQPPVAERRPHASTLHGVTRVDDFHWLRDRSDPAVLAYLEAENAYAAAVTQGLAELRESIYQEIKAKVREDDLSAPAREGDFWYCTKTEQGKQYPAVVRWRHRPEGEPSVVLDQNELAAGEQFCGLGYLLLSPDQNRLAYAVDFSGNETFEIRFLQLEPRAELADRLQGAYYGGAWSADGQSFLYNTLDHAHRADRAWLHRLGTPQSADILIYEETDKRFDLDIFLSRDRTMALIALASNTTSEYRYLPTADPAQPLQVLIPRRPGVRYQAEPHRGRWLVVTDENAPNGRLLSLDPAVGDVGLELIAHDPARKVGAVMPFAKHLVVTGRMNGNPTLTVIPEAGDRFDIFFPDEAYRFRIGENREYETGTLRAVYESFLAPRRVIDIDLETGQQTLVKEVAVPGGYDRGRYRERRLWAATDSVHVPITLVHGRDLQFPAPTLVYGYGAYESTLDPHFDPALFPLLDRGVVYAVAHVRGGGEMGRLWHLDGRMDRKVNTFADFIAVTEHLLSTGIAEEGRIAARGVSAGGLLMGAVTVARPDLWSAVVAEVPFVDVINTMLDPGIPLTVAEWEEWGNPARPDEYRYMNSYSPYDNIGLAAYPAVLATAALSDPRVAYWEPAKWVAKLRAANTGDRPILLKTDFGSGHSGPSGRYDAWVEEAFVLAFILDQLGVSRLRPG